MRRPKDIIQKGKSIAERARDAVTEKKFVARVLNVANCPGEEGYMLVKLQSESGSRRQLMVAATNFDLQTLKSGDRVECVVYRDPSLKVRKTRFATIFPLND